MKPVLVSMYVHNGVFVISIYADGRLKEKYNGKLSSKGNNYDKALELYSKALKYTRKFVEHNSEYTDVTFEMTNSTIIKWFNEGFSKKEYMDKFSEVMLTLQSIPIRYRMVMNKEPRCKSLFTEKISSLELSKLTL